MMQTQLTAMIVQRLNESQAHLEQQFHNQYPLDITERALH